ncbi:MAG: SGNH/GDSL hydrolase family protein [Verrucomicrobia bacterium]|nr:SGNH/GDSL hydrolase family protein [Verrucomicrobiota bacterium]
MRRHRPAGNAAGLRREENFAPSRLAERLGCGFQLHAPQQTTVECELKGGKIVKLKIEPEARRKDLQVAAGFETGSTGDSARFIGSLQTGRKATIVTLGTSLTGGTWRWVNVMKEWLDSEYPGLATIQNLGVGASASSHPPGQCGLDMAKRAAAMKPDVVFIEFAVNDSYLPYKISPTDSQRNLNMMVDTILQANPNAEIVVQTTNPVIDMPDAVNRHATNRPDLAEYYQGYRDVARARGLILIDHYPNWHKLLDAGRDGFLQRVPDGIHPQEPGYREVVLPELKRVLLGNS